MDRETLLRLREEIMASAQQLATNDAGDPADRLQLLMQVVRGGGASPEILRKTYDLTSELPDGSEKMSNFMELLDETDIYLSNTLGATENQQGDLQPEIAQSDENQS